MGAGPEGDHFREFGTESTNVHGLAMMLHHLGLEQIVATEPGFRVDESRLGVNLDMTRIAHGGWEWQRKRKGMRVNLRNLGEVVSLWPGKSAQINHRHDIFKSGFD